jgi:hypothetical protein
MEIQMSDHDVREFVAMLTAHCVRLFYDPGTEPIRITSTLTADDVILIIRDPEAFQAQQLGASRETCCKSQGLDRELAEQGVPGVKEPNMDAQTRQLCHGPRSSRTIRTAADQPNCRVPPQEAAS